jgi:hypothetical protein
MSTKHSAKLNYGRTVEQLTCVFRFRQNNGDHVTRVAPYEFVLSLRFKNRPVWCKIITWD